jgi:membrane protease subunit (stomatin/prohibitin family)
MCDQCQALTINGVYCHETDCPVAYLDQTKECFVCGCDYQPESRHQSICPDCADPQWECPECGNVETCDCE